MIATKKQLQLENKALKEEIDSLIESSRHFDEKYDKLKIEHRATIFAKQLLTVSNDKTVEELDKVTKAMFKLIDKL